MEFRFHKEVNIPPGKIAFQRELVIPQKAVAIVIFSHGNGSGLFSRHNQTVAKQLLYEKIWDPSYLIY